MNSKDWWGVGNHDIGETEFNRYDTKGYADLPEILLMGRGGGCMIWLGAICVIVRRCQHRWHSAIVALRRATPLGHGASVPFVPTIAVSGVANVPEDLPGAASALQRVVRIGDAARGHGW